MSEENNWFDLIGLEGLYQMNDEDEVKSLKRVVKCGKCGFRVVEEIILKQSVNKKTGHIYVNLSKNGIKERVGIHMLKARQFIPNPNNLPIVDHIDGKPWNNELSNLQWITNAGNATKGHYYDGNRKQIKPILQYTKQGEFVAEHQSIAEAQRLFTHNITSHVISQHLRKPIRHKTAYGYIWKYKQ